MTTIPQFLQIMTEAETFESKRKVDESLNTVIEQSGSLVCRLSHHVSCPYLRFVDTTFYFRHY